MVVGTVRIRLVLRAARSLKDKRSVVCGLKERLRRRFNVSVAEVDCQDVIKTVELAAAQVSSDSRYVQRSLSKLVDAVRGYPAAELVDYEIEIY
jgi:uncharacterized protein YlxP (DUF503 family)